MVAFWIFIAVGEVSIDSVRTLFQKGEYRQVLTYAREGKQTALDPKTREAYAYLEVLSLYQLQRWEEAASSAQAFLDTYPEGNRRGYVAYAGGRSSFVLDRPLDAFRMVVRGYKDAETDALKTKLAGILAALWSVDTAQARGWLDRPVFRKRAQEETNDILVWLPMGGERHPVGRAFLAGLKMGLGNPSSYRIQIGSGQHPELSLQNHPPLILVGPLLSREVAPLYPVLEQQVIPTILPLALAPMKIPPPWILYHMEGDLEYLQATIRTLREVEAESVVVLYEDFYEPLARRLKREVSSFLTLKDSTPVEVRLFPMDHRISSVLEKLDLVRTMAPPWVVVFAQSEVMEWISQAYLQDSLPSLWFLPPHTRGAVPPGFVAWGAWTSGWRQLAQLRKKVRATYYAQHKQEADLVVLRGFDVGWMIQEALKAKPRNGLELALLLRKRQIFYGIQSTWVTSPKKPFWITQPESEQEVQYETATPKAAPPHP